MENGGGEGGRTHALTNKAEQTKLLLTSRAWEEMVQEKSHSKIIGIQSWMRPWRSFLPTPQITDEETGLKSEQLSQGHS